MGDPGSVAGTADNSERFLHMSWTAEILGTVCREFFAGFAAGERAYEAERSLAASRSSA